MLTVKGPGSNVCCGAVSKMGLKFLPLCCYIETVKTNQLRSHTKEHSGKNQSFLTSWSRRTLRAFSASELPCNQQQVYNAQQPANSSKARRVDPFLISLTVQRLLSHGHRFARCVSVDTCPSCVLAIYTARKYIFVILAIPFAIWIARCIYQLMHVSISVHRLNLEYWNNWRHFKGWEVLFW